MQLVPSLLLTPFPMPLRSPRQSPTRLLLLQLSLLGLHLVFHLSSLLARTLKKLFALLANLIPHLIHLTFSFLTDSSSTHQLFTLQPCFLNDLLSLTFG